MAMENAKRAQQRLIAAGYELKADGDFGGKSLAALMAYIASILAFRTVTQLRTDLGTAAARHFALAKINTPLRIAHALAQQSVETGGFSKLVESFNYTPERLHAVFNTASIRISEADRNRLGRQAIENAVPVARQREIANLVYGGAWGKKNLGNEKPDDGWVYRGRGAKQTTGRKNYTDVKAVTLIDVIANPALLESPDRGMEAAVIYWMKRNCNPIADADDIRKLTQTVNGGLTGLADRELALKRAKAILL
jgi:putative chitinase